MIYLFIYYQDLIKDFDYIYSIFYHYNIKIKLIKNNIDIINYIKKKEDNDYIYYNIFDIELFNDIKLIFNKIIYYLSIELDLDNFNEKYKKIRYVLINNNKQLLRNYKNEKIILINQDTKNKEEIIINNMILKKKIKYYNIVNEDFGFIILRHVNTYKINRLWLKNIKNIRKYYNNKIYIIDDNSNKKYLSEERFNNVEIIKSEYKSRGEILPYYYLLKKELFRKCIIIHDSVFINRYINFDKYKKDIYYLWHFGHNANNLIDENKMMNILENNKIIEKYDEKGWYGCFGVQTIITLDFVKKLDKEYKIFKLIEFIDTRSKRMNFERVFSVLCTLINNNLYKEESIYGEIHKYIEWEYSYDKYIEEENNNKRDYELIKTWNGR